MPKPNSIIMSSSRDNLIRTLRREGFDHVPVDFWLCDSQIKAFQERFGHEDYESWFNLSHRRVEMEVKRNYKSGFDLYKRETLPADTQFEEYGIGHSMGSELAFHMTRMHHPLRGADLNEILDYPYPTIDQKGKEEMAKEVAGLHERGLASLAFMQMTVWEASWYLRSMEELMMDMMMEDEKAPAILDKITHFACAKAAAYTEAGVDILSLGDDIGTQTTIMMDVGLWEKWLKPRLSKVIDTARNINPDVLIFYHSCGYIIPFIDQLIEVGVDILNPIQPECMEFDEVHDMFGERVSFWGTVGTQQVLPFGTAEEVRQVSLSRLQKCGGKGGICLGPTHLVEPEVPWENLLAIRQAVEEYESSLT
jgi:uroporphyrinogen decarboxylase